MSAFTMMFRFIWIILEVVIRGVDGEAIAWWEKTGCPEWTSLLQMEHFRTKRVNTDEALQMLGLSLNFEGYFVVGVNGTTFWRGTLQVRIFRQTI